MKEFRFECVQCGKCCSSAPEMTVMEAIDLHREFVLMLKIGGVADVDHMQVTGQLRSRAAGVKSSDLKAQFDHLVSMGAVVVGTGGIRIAMRLSAVSLSAPSVGKCPKLDDDGRCSIHDRRPNFCRSMPFDYWSDERRQPLRLDLVKRKIDADGWQCRTGDEAPVVWRDGVIVDEEFRKPYLDGIARSKEDWVVMDAISREMVAGSKHVPTVTQAAGAILAGDGYRMDFLGAVTILNLFKEHVGDKAPMDLSALPSVQEFLAVQLSLIDEQIAANKARKSSLDRSSTEQLRSLRDHYAAAVEPS